jgi:SRSO17 transposase
MRIVWSEAKHLPSAAAGKAWAKEKDQSTENRTFFKKMPGVALRTVKTMEKAKFKLLGS